MGKRSGFERRPRDNEVQRAMSLLRYDPETGEFFWRVNRANVKAGDRAGSVNAIGYVGICIDYKRQYAHRLAIAFTTGSFPVPGMYVDHINGDRADNRSVNLRMVSGCINNLHRTRLNKNNTSGFGGVRRVESGKFEATIMLNHRHIGLGLFATFEQAVARRKAATAECIG